MDHLFFADDCCIFGKASNLICDEILCVFFMRNCQVVNRAKTQVFFGSNVQKSDRDSFTILLVGQETNSFYRYLGSQLLLVTLDVLHLKV